MTGQLLLRDYEYYKTKKALEKYQAHHKNQMVFDHVVFMFKQIISESVAEENPQDQGNRIQRDALLGKQEAVTYYIDKIRNELSRRHVKAMVPPWYNSLEEGIFQEIYGLFCLSNWFDLQESQSAKVIGDRIYYMIDGKPQLQPQRLSFNRRKRLRQNLIMNDTEGTERSLFNEITLSNGCRVTIYSEQITKEGQDSMVFRKYVLRDMSYQEQARRHTIPPEAVNFFEAFSQVGWNVLFTGAMRSGKTTFANTWQTHEDPTLEGVLVEMTDEMSLHQQMPDSPIMQLLVTEHELSQIQRTLMRSDADYFVMSEARTGQEFNLMVTLANKGTNRCKTTVHATRAQTAIYHIAEQIAAMQKTNTIDNIIMSVAESFHFIIHLQSLPKDKSQKRLEGIYQVESDRLNKQIKVHTVCKYDQAKDNWQWHDYLCDTQIEVAKKEGGEAFEQFNRQLQKLSHLHPMEKTEPFVCYKEK